MSFRKQFIYGHILLLTISNNESSSSIWFLWRLLNQNTRVTNILCQRRFFLQFLNTATIEFQLVWLYAKRQNSISASQNVRWRMCLTITLVHMKGLTIFIQMNVLEVQLRSEITLAILPECNPNEIIMICS